jgi:hypothetical protein
VKRPMSLERRARLAEAARAQKIRQRGEVVWTAERIKRIQREYAIGGRRGAIAAFFDMRTPQVSAAIRRYCSGPSGSTTGINASHAARQSQGKCWDDPDFHRRFLEALTGMTRLEYQP